MVRGRQFLRRGGSVGIFLLALAGALILIPAGQAGAEPMFNVEIDEGEEIPALGTGVRLVLLLTVLAVAPAILLMVTCFTRIVIVLGFVRNALATREMPPNQVLLGLALFMTIFVMAPVWGEVYEEAWVPLQEDEIELDAAYANAAEPVSDFMMQYTREQDLELFMGFAGEDRPESPDDVPLYALVPAFATSELKTAFQMGFIVFLPFIVIDMVVASTLMSMGMLMLPPMMISLPFKILLFVMVDGWHLVMESLLEGLAG